MKSGPEPRRHFSLVVAMATSFGSIVIFAPKARTRSVTSSSRGGAQEAKVGQGPIRGGGEFEILEHLEIIAIATAHVKHDRAPAAAQAPPGN